MTRFEDVSGVECVEVTEADVYQWPFDVSECLVSGITSARTRTVCSFVVVLPSTYGCRVMTIRAMGMGNGGKTECGGHYLASTAMQVLVDQIPAMHPSCPVVLRGDYKNGCKWIRSGL